jgi:hypothetical protein
MTGPPRNDMIAIHMSGRPSQRAQPRHDCDKGDAQQYASGDPGIPDRGGNLTPEVGVPQGVRDVIDDLQRGADKRQTIAPCNRQRTEASFLNLREHQISLSLASSLAARSRSLSTSAATPLVQTLIAGHE